MKYVGVNFFLGEDKISTAFFLFPLFMLLNCSRFIAKGGVWPPKHDNNDDTDASSVTVDPAIQPPAVARSTTATPSDALHTVTPATTKTALTIRGATTTSPVLVDVHGTVWEEDEDICKCNFNGTYSDVNGASVTPKLGRHILMASTLSKPSLVLITFYSPFCQTLSVTSSL